MAKHSGKGSKKAQRRLRAQARKEEFDALSSEEKEIRKAHNAEEYHYWHDEEEHLNGGEREARRELGLPLHSQ